MLFTAAVFTGLYLRFDFTGAYAVNGIFSICLITAGIVDLRLRVLPNIINAAGVVLAFLISLIRGAAGPSASPIVDFFAGGAACGVPLLLIAIVSKRGMGMGDVKFAALIGTFLGVYSGLCALWLSIVMGGVYGAVLIILKKATRKTPVPFGPFMVLGALVMVFFGDFIKPLLWEAYHVRARS
ncbi:MAG: A24 family peptidase [Clostridiales bacterium]|jgi:leader peptidase (prepilin peptidase)/N-methyltransferase|nr:A24 family peptidase [Clostridiales bacterium]